MAAVAVLAAMLFVAVKTVSYGIWEMRRQNKAGGGFAVVLAGVGMALAVRFLIKYWA